MLLLRSDSVENEGLSPNTPENCGFGHNTVPLRFFYPSAYCVSTYLLYLNTHQKLNTVEHGVVRGLIIAGTDNCKTRELAKDYADISEGDHVIACTGDGVRWKALVDEIIHATDDDDESPGKGEQVKILKGKLIARGNRSIAATVKRMKDNGIDVPVLFNPRGSGFKQGALAKLLTEEQENELDTGLK